MNSFKNKEDSKQRKIEGLLKLIQQKDNEIGLLKNDIIELKSSFNINNTKSNESPIVVSLI